MTNTHGMAKCEWQFRYTFIKGRILRRSQSYVWHIHTYTPYEQYICNYTSCVACLIIPWQLRVAEISLEEKPPVCCSTYFNEFSLEMKWIFSSGSCLLFSKLAANTYDSLLIHFDDKHGDKVLVICICGRKIERKNFNIKNITRLPLLNIYILLI